MALFVCYRILCQGALVKRNVLASLCTKMALDMYISTKVKVHIMTHGENIQSIGSIYLCLNKAVRYERYSTRCITTVAKTI